MRAYVGVGRDYVVLDAEASSSSGAMFSQVRGLDYIPQQFLEHRFRDVPLDAFVENEFWVQSVKILKANVFVADHPNLFAIRMVNFACGPDSLKIYQEEQIHQAVNKPLLVLLTDAQTNNAPVVSAAVAQAIQAIVLFQMKDTLVDTAVGAQSSQAMILVLGNKTTVMKTLAIDGPMA